MDKYPIFVIGFLLVSIIVILIAVGRVLSLRNEYQRQMCAVLSGHAVWTLGPQPADGSRPEVVLKKLDEKEAAK